MYYRYLPNIPCQIKRTMAIIKFLKINFWLTEFDTSNIHLHPVTCNESVVDKSSSHSGILFIKCWQCLTRYILAFIYRRTSLMLYLRVDRLVGCCLSFLYCYSTWNMFYSIKLRDIGGQNLKKLALVRKQF